MRKNTPNKQANAMPIPRNAVVLVPNPVHKKLNNPFFMMGNFFLKKIILRERDSLRMLYF